MKITNAIIYGILPGVLPVLANIEEALSAHAFAPCGPTQQISSGFVPPRAEHGALIESIGGQWIAKLMIETRAVPSSAVNRALKERVAQIETSTGRKPGKKETREIKDDIVQALLPQAFPRQSSVNLWLDPSKNLLVLDTASQNKADLAATAIVKGIEGLALVMASTVRTPATAMSEWLLAYEAPEGFDIGRDCELQASDESGAVVRYASHTLDIEEIREHITNGMRPARLALTYNGRVSFVLSDAGTVRSIVYLDGVMDADGKAEDAFDADVALFTGELALMLADLTEALGGVAQATITESKPGEGADAKKSEPPAPIADGEPDPLYDQAIAIVRENNKPSISLVQRHLHLGYNRAARLLERMEAYGIVSAMDGSGTRKVIA